MPKTNLALRRMADHRWFEPLGLASSSSRVSAWLRIGPGGHTWHSPSKHCDTNDRIEIEKDTAWKTFNMLCSKTRKETEWFQHWFRTLQRQRICWVGKKPSVKYHFSSSPTTSIKQFQYDELRARHGSEKGSFQWNVFEFPLTCSSPEVEQAVLSPGAETPFQGHVGAVTWQL